MCHEQDEDYEGTMSLTQVGDATIGFHLDADSKHDAHDEKLANKDADEDDRDSDHDNENTETDEDDELDDDAPSSGRGNEEA